MRLWEVNFQVYKPLPSLPMPGDLVEEIQEEPSYRHDGYKRRGGGGQMVLTMRGEGGFRIGKKDLRLKPGTAFLALHCDPEHSYYYPPEGVEPWIFFWIAVWGKTAEAMITDLVKRYGYLYNLETDRGIIKRLYSYKRVKNTVRAISPPAGARLAADVLCALGESKETGLSETPASALVQRAQQLVFENLAKELNVTDVAERLGVSREHLSRVFREQTGFSPLEYMARQKMRVACRLLRETTMPCKEAAMRTGFENVSCFNRIFKRMTGLSPSEFRSSGGATEFE